MSRKELDRLFKRIERASGISRDISVYRLELLCRSLFL